MNYVLGDFECKAKMFKCNLVGMGNGIIRQEELGWRDCIQGDELTATVLC